MVRVGKDKKRRARRTGRTKLKNRNYRRWNPKPSFSDPVVKRQWDPSKSPAANMQQMGLRAKPNLAKEMTGPETDERYTEQNQMAGNESSIIKLFDVPHSDTPKKRPLSGDDQRYICRCVSKHGVDYVAIFRDLKVNRMQHTETKLRKMASRFFLLDPDQRVVEVPDKVKHLIQES